VWFGWANGKESRATLLRNQSGEIQVSDAKSDPSRIRDEKQLKRREKQSGG
jgi:hypothetical protein